MEALLEHDACDAEKGQAASMQLQQPPSTTVATEQVGVAPVTPPPPQLGYEDLLLDLTFLLPFLSLSCLTLGAFGIVRGMCSDGVPGNCSLPSNDLILNQLLACIERIFLVTAVSNFAFLFPRDTWRERGALAYAAVMHLVALAASVVVSAGLKDYSIRQGMKPLRIGVAVILLVLLLPPLVYCIVAQYTKRQRFKALAIFVVYLAFLCANGGIGGLHIHHWTWSFCYLVLLYPPTRVPESQRSSWLHRIFVLWSHAGSMIALGILIQGLAAYGSTFFFS